MTLDHMDDIDWALLARYLSGACSREEARAFEQWAAERPDRAREIEVLRAAWHEASKLSVPRRAERAFHRVAARVGLAAGSSGERSGGASRTPRFTLGTPKARSRWVGVAMRIAAVLVLLLASWVAFERGGRPSAIGTARAFVTLPAQRLTVDLVDGTRVTLGAASRLDVPVDFGDRTRTVMLTGEAYFVVAHQARPFRVRTATTTAEDLGTAFVVSARPRDSVVNVVVVEGKVVVRPGTATPGHGVVLSRGQLARVATSGLVSVTADVDVAAWLAWMEGRLDFHKVPLATVRAVLERWYDVRIELPDSTLASVPVSASFDGQTADEALGTLARLLGLRYVRQGATVRFLARPVSLTR